MGATLDRDSWGGNCREWVVSLRVNRRILGDGDKLQSLSDLQQWL